ncbi:MAG: PAS domain S-box protein [Chitinophagales bacterium]
MMFDSPNTNKEIKRLKQELKALSDENELLNKQLLLLESDVMDSDTRFTQLYKAAFEGIAVYHEGRITLVNEALCKIFGYERYELLEQDITIFLAPFDKEDGIQTIERESNFVECICVRKDKSCFPAKIIGKKIPYKGAEAQVLVIHDITKDKKVRQQLEQSERLYQKLFEESRDAIYISGVRGHMLKVNQATIDLFGYTEKEMLGMSVLRLYANLEDRQNFMHEIMQQGSVNNYEVKLVQKDGELIDCILSSSTRRNANMEIIGFQGIIRDITERKRTNELVKAKELAEKSAVMKEKFLANMSHEIRTPMNAVIGMTNLLLDTPISKHQLKYVKGIQNASEHLLVLINDILDFSKIEAGKLSIEKIEFSLSTVVNNVIQTFKYKVKEKELDFFVNKEDGILDSLFGDPTRLIQILLNLLSNAIKFTDKGSVTLNIKQFTEDAENATIAFEVIDTGIGIPKEKIATIFDSFSQVSSTTTRRFGGTGLGLSITKKLVEMQGGNISVKSTVGVGTTFFFIIKFKRGNEKNLKKLENLKDIAVQPLGELRILLAEDNPLNQVVAKDTIKKWGKNLVIDIANDGIEAIDRLRAEKYDLVLMDVQMPRMNGLNTTRHIRTVLKLTDLPILAMTAYATTGEAEKTIMAGMNDYISKPFNPKKLYEKIYTLTKEKHIGAEPLEEEKVDSSTTKEKSEKLEQSSSITDFSFLNEAVGNDPELKRQMLEIMLQETPEETMQMQIFLKKEDWPRLRSVAHKFKSAVTYMGLHNLKEVVKTIQENAEKRVHLDQLPELVELVYNTCQHAIKEMRAELKYLKNGEKAVEKPLKKRITDLSYLDEVIDGDMSLKKQMLEIMLQETPEEVAKMQIFVDVKDWDKLRSVAHKFKSTVTYMGLHDLKETVKTIQENAEKRIDLDNMAFLVEKVTTQCESAIVELEEELKQILI